MASAAPVEKIDIGRVISRAFEALRANFLPFFLLSAVLAGVPAFLSNYWTMSALGRAGGDPAFVLSLGYWGPLLGGFAVTVVAWALLQGVLVRSTVLYLSGREADVSQSVTIALGLVLPIIALSIAVGVLAAIGFICLIVPGFMVYCAFIVAVPALIEERRGVSGSLQRSRDLTRGSRKRIFLLLVVFWVFSVIISGVLNAISGLTPFGVYSRTPDPILIGATGAIGSALSSVIVAVGVAALYVELRTVKEGATTSDLAAIFD